MSEVVVVRCSHTATDLQRSARLLPQLQDASARCQLVVWSSASAGYWGVESLESGGGGTEADCCCTASQPVNVLTCPTRPQPGRADVTRHSASSSPSLLSLCCVDDTHTSCNRVTNHVRRQQSRHLLIAVMMHRCRCRFRR